MRPTLLSMIAPSSLSAFSARIGVSRDGSAVNGASPIQPVRAQSQAAPQSTLGRSGPATSGAQTPPTPAPGQCLPRGSLLDLSV